MLRDLIPSKAVHRTARIYGSGKLETDHLPYLLCRSKQSSVQRSPRIPDVLDLSHVQLGSKPALGSPVSHFRSAPISTALHGSPARRIRADSRPSTSTYPPSRGSRTLTL